MIAKCLSMRHIILRGQQGVYFSAWLCIYVYVTLGVGGSKASTAYTALLQYPDIAQEGGFQLSFDLPFDPTFHLQVTAVETSFLYIVGLVTFTCGIEFLY